MLCKVGLVLYDETRIPSTCMVDNNTMDPAPVRKDAMVSRPHEAAQSGNKPARYAAMHVMSASCDVSMSCSVY